MPVTIQIDKAAKVVFSTFNGEISEADFSSTVETLPTQPGFDPDFAHIIDFSNATALKVSKEFIWAMAKQQPIFSRAARQIVVAPQDYVFGLARMTQMLREQLLPNIEVVRSLKMACEILDIRHSASE